MITITNLHVSYGKLEVLRGVNLEIKDGEFIGIIGSNGAGKSTLLKTIAGLIRVKEGEIKLVSKNITKITTQKRLELGIAYVPQGNKIFPTLTVEENLELISKNYEHTLNLFPNLQSKINEKAGQLSGGEQQMLSIARALVNKPKYLLLDEPSLGLSPLYVQKTFEVLRKINQEEKVTLIIVEQNVNTLMQYANYAYLLELGKIKQKVTSEDLRAKEFQKTYLGV